MLPQVHAEGDSGSAGFWWCEKAGGDEQGFGDAESTMVERRALHDTVMQQCRDAVGKFLRGAATIKLRIEGKPEMEVLGFSRSLRHRKLGLHLRLAHVSFYSVTSKSASRRTDLL